MTCDHLTQLAGREKAPENHVDEAEREEKQEEGSFRKANRRNPTSHPTVGRFDSGANGFASKLSVDRH
jgi:hypothetical protein